MAYIPPKRSKRKRARTCGFRVRMRKSPKVLKSRRAKGRWKLTPILHQWK